VGRATREPRRALASAAPDSATLRTPHGTVYTQVCLSGVNSPAITPPPLRLQLSPSPPSPVVVGDNVPQRVPDETAADSLECFGDAVGLDFVVADAGHPRVGGGEDGLGLDLVDQRPGSREASGGKGRGGREDGRHRADEGRPAADDDGRRRGGFGAEKSGGTGGATTPLPGSAARRGGCRHQMTGCHLAATRAETEESSHKAAYILAPSRVSPEFCPDNSGRLQPRAARSIPSRLSFAELSEPFSSHDSAPGFSPRLASRQRHRVSAARHLVAGEQLRVAWGRVSSGGPSSRDGLALPV